MQFHLLWVTTIFGFVIMSPNYQTWAIAQAITNTLLSMVKQCVLNQSQGFWLLDVFASTFTLYILMKYELARI
jgi:di/tricarboxylate transporter